MSMVLPTSQVLPATGQALATVVVNKSTGIIPWWFKKGAEKLAPVDSGRRYDRNTIEKYVKLGNEFSPSSRST